MKIHLWPSKYPKVPSGVRCCQNKPNSWYTRFVQRFHKLDKSAFFSLTNYLSPIINLYVIHQWHHFLFVSDKTQTWCRQWGTPMFYLVEHGESGQIRGCRAHVDWSSDSCQSFHVLTVSLGSTSILTYIFQICVTCWTSVLVWAKLTC